jgi:hypothetical protein
MKLFFILRKIKASVKSLPGGTSLKVAATFPPLSK